MYSGSMATQQLNCYSLLVSNNQKNELTKQYKKSVYINTLKDLECSREPCALHVYIDYTKVIIIRILIKLECQFPILLLNCNLIVQSMLLISRIYPLLVP